MTDLISRYAGLVLGVFVLTLSCWPLDIWHFIGAFVGANIMVLWAVITGPR